MNKVTLGNDVETAALTVANFPAIVPLSKDVRYYWAVDCHDPVKGVIEGELWSFFIGQVPVADAGPDQVAWLDGNPSVVINLNGTASDDGPYTVLWTQVSGPTAVTPVPDNTEDTSVTITQRGVYVFTLTADDSHLKGSDTVQVIVGTDSCDASVLNGSAYSSNVDLADFADFAADWMVCTNTLEGCL
jgi:hypothetical protein